MLPKTVERARDQADLQCMQPRPVNWIDFCKEEFGGASTTSQVSSTKRLSEISGTAAWNKQVKRPHPRDVDSFTKETWFMHLLYHDLAICTVPPTYFISTGRLSNTSGNRTF